MIEVSFRSRLAPGRLMIQRHRGRIRLLSWQFGPFSVAWSRERCKAAMFRRDDYQMVTRYWPSMRRVGRQILEGEVVGGLWR